jgi:hypothetical protein
MEEQSFEADVTDDATIERILELFASNIQNEDALCNPCDDITPSYLGTAGSTPQPVFEKTDCIFKPDQNVCQMQEYPLTFEETSEKNIISQNRFATSVIALNSLAFQCIIRNHQGSNANKTQHATGTVESVLQWGMNDNLDTNQKLAFEILAATYILTFHNDAIGTEALDEFDGLEELTQKKKTTISNYACF